MRETDNVISIESNAHFSEITAKMCAMAGIGNVSFIAKPTSEAIEEIHEQGTEFDISARYDA